MTDVIDTYRPGNVGGIYTRDIQMTANFNENTRFHTEEEYREHEVKELTINSIVNSLKNEYDTMEKNKKFSKVNTVYGDFNEAGLQAFPNSLIKLNEKNTNKTALFNMRY